jgi:hypothetical protein
MKYLCLIYSDPKIWEKMPKDELDQMLAAYMQFTGSIQESGHYREAARLQPSHTATTVRLREGQLSTTDGPYAETKEQLGGFYLIEARDLNEAIQVASRIPAARYGSVEVRPVMERMPQ